MLPHSFLDSIVSAVQDECKKKRVGRTKIEESAFEGNSAITVAYVQDGCAEIGANAFKGCTGLKQIRLPENCSIADSAFAGCSQLIAIYGPAGGTAQGWALMHKIPFVPYTGN
jgi:hypothetical protein